MKRSLLLVLAILCASPAAIADEPSASAYRLPPVLPLERPEAPSREPDDVPRRKIEIVFAPVAGRLGCAGSAPRTTATPDPCAALGTSFGVEGRVLLRPIPFVALGAEAAIERFAWDASHGVGSGDASASWTRLAVAARGYFLESGTFDPWFGFSIGAGWLSMRSADETGGSELWRNGIVSTAELGFDAWISQHARLGGFGGIGWQPGSGVERCAAGTCLDASGTVARIPDHAFRAGLTVTVATGDEL